MELELDFSQVSTLEAMHELLKEKFGFPDFYGKNVNALIDCWSSLRNAEDGMTTITLQKEELLTLKVIALPMNNFIILNHFLLAIQAVNQRFMHPKKPVIKLLLI